MAGWGGGVGGGGGGGLGLQANPFTVFFLLKMRKITREYSRINSTSGWVKKVELYTSV